MELLDWIVIGGYFAVLAGLAWWVIRQSKNTSDDYFLAGHSLGWFIVGASIFASNIGSEHLVGLAGSGATDGVAMAHYELNSWCILVLAWVLVPFYARSKVFTMPQFLERRFSESSRYLLSVISLVAYVVTKIAVGIYAGGIVFSVLLPELKMGPLDSFWIGSLLVLVFTGLYTVLGGFRAVAYTETLQTAVLIVGSALVTYFGLLAVGGWGGMYETLGSDKFNLWQPITTRGADGEPLPVEWAPIEQTEIVDRSSVDSDKEFEEINGKAVKENDLVVEGKKEVTTRQAWYFNSNYPWPGMLFCVPVIGMWYWCTDQYIVQRALGAKDETEARRGSIFAAILKILPTFIFLVPGMICMALIEQAKSDPAGYDFSAMLDPQTGDVVEKEKAFPLMVQNLLPAGVRGLVVAGLLSALMSSLAGVFNACSTLFTMDLYKKFVPDASDKRLVYVGRVATGVMIIVGMAWIPVIKNSDSGLYYYLQAVQGYLAPPIFVVFFMGIAWKRLNAAGCLAALLVGFTLGLFRLAVDTVPTYYGENFAYTEGTFLWIVNKIYFQYFSLIIAIVSAAVMVGVSLATRAPDYDRISGLTYGVLTKEDRERSRASWSIIDVALTLFVLAFIVAAYIFFRG